MYMFIYICIMPRGDAQFQGKKTGREVEEQKAKKDIENRKGL